MVSRTKGRNKDHPAGKRKPSRGDAKRRRERPVGDDEESEEEEKFTYQKSFNLTDNP